MRAIRPVRRWFIAFILLAALAGCGKVFPQAIGTSPDTPIATKQVYADSIQPTSIIHSIYMSLSQTDPNSEVFWVMVSAIGTVLAVVVALFTTLYFKILKPILEQPKLVIKFKNESPYSVENEVVVNGNRGSLGTCRLIRLGLQNNSRTPAEKPRIKITAITDKDGNLTPGFLPYDLNWVDTGTIERENICYKEEAYADLLIGMTRDPKYWWLQPYDPSQQGDFRQVKRLGILPIQMQTISFIETVAYAKNLKKRPRKASFECTYCSGKLNSFEMERGKIPNPVIRAIKNTIRNVWKKNRKSK